MATPTSSAELNLARPDAYSLAVSCVLFLLPSLALLVRTGISLIEIAILAASIWHARTLWRQRDLLFADAKRIVLSVVLIFALGTLSLLLTGFDWRFLENPSKALLVVPVIGLVAMSRPRADWLWYGLCIGTLGAALTAGYQRFVLFAPRAEGVHMAIMFGDVAMAMGLMGLAGIARFAGTRLAWLPVFTFLCGLLASVLSGTRGGWMALVLSFIPLTTYGSAAAGRRILAIGAAGIVLLAGAVFVPQLGVRERMVDVVTDVQKYEAGDPFTSVGLRFENWKGAVKMFTEHPLTGVGRANYGAQLEGLAKQGQLHPSIAGLRHAHNEMLNALATEGLIGGLALAFLYAAPFVFFVRRLRSDDPARPYALAGLLLVLSFIDFGMTQVLFAHHIGSAFYTIGVGALAGLCIALRRTSAQ
ncbi:O-antigen ligase family protein [Oxalobacteraceae bacterium OM1]|nr:O-antigen ligase family protein [Oxalobacteraceae bacterium OM1]